MNKMSEEEVIEILKIELENTKRANECGLATKGEFDKQIQAIETILDLYQQEKEKNKELYKDNKKQWDERCRLAIELDNNTISKDKIRAKIEEVKRKREEEWETAGISMLGSAIDVLKELLEEE